MIRTSWDHPRACGEQSTVLHVLELFKGSSPRVRGAAACPHLSKFSIGIIPARAGSSAQYICRACREGDHPRACGEQLPYQMRAATSLGSSPRVRGAGKPVGTSKNVHGIIPARAGSSFHSPSPCLLGWDHPRACGEQNNRATHMPAQKGSSPRVRGAE